MKAAEVKGLKDRERESCQIKDRLHFLTMFAEAEEANVNVFFQLGNSSIGIRVREGVVIAVERKQESKLMIPKTSEKICEVHQINKLFA